LPNDNCEQLMSLFIEYEERKSPESKLTKEIDVYDMLQQAHEYECSEYERTGQTPDFSCFFREKLIAKITHPAMRPLLDQLLKERTEFLAGIPNTPILRPVLKNSALTISPTLVPAAAVQPIVVTLPLDKKPENGRIESTNVAVA
jgi:hypothetical protein